MGKEGKTHDASFAEAMAELRSGPLADLSIDLTGGDRAARRMAELEARRRIRKLEGTSSAARAARDLANIKRVRHRLTKLHIVARLALAGLVAAAAYYLSGGAIEAASSSWNVARGLSNDEPLARTIISILSFLWVMLKT